MKTALVVDDEPLIRRQVAETLTKYGFEEILEAQNGKQAVDLAVAGFDRRGRALHDILAGTWIAYRPPADRGA